MRKIGFGKRIRDMGSSTSSCAATSKKDAKSTGKCPNNEDCDAISIASFEAGALVINRGQAIGLINKNAWHRMGSRDLRALLTSIRANDT